MDKFVEADTDEREPEDNSADEHAVSIIIALVVDEEIKSNDLSEEISDDEGKSLPEIEMIVIGVTSLEPTIKKESGKSEDDDDRGE